MKLLNSIRWRSSRRTIATTPSWIRLISTSSPMLQEAATTPVEIQNPAAPKRQKSQTTPKRWTADELQLVVDEVRKGASMRAIAKLLPDRKLLAVLNMIRCCRYNNDIGVSKGIKRKWTAEEKKKLLQLKEAGTATQNIMSQFPDRTYKSIAMALHRPRSDMFWSTAPSKRIAWTDTADKALIERLSSGTSTEEAALLFGRSIDAIRERSRKLGISLSRRWTPEEDETLLRMVPEGYTAEHIGSFLGRGHYSVKRRWYVVRPVDSIRVSRKSGPIEPTSAEMQTVERLRQEGSTWEAIKASTFPDRELQQVYHTFQRAYKHHPEKIAKPRDRFSPSEIEDMESLLKDRIPWRVIAASRFPDLTPATLRRLYLKQIGHSNNSSIPSVDIAEIKRLRSTGFTWKQIAVTNYPGIHWPRVRDRFLKQLELRSEELGTHPASTAASAGEEVKKEEQEEEEYSAR